MDLFSELFSAPQENVHETYTKLRESDDGVHVDESLNTVLVMRYADAEKVFRRKESFSSDTFWASPAAIYDPGDPKQARYADHFKNFLLFLDPPKHTRLRNLVRHAFTPDAINSMAHITTATADRILGEFEPDQEVEFVSQIAELLPIQVIATMIGVPLSDHANFRRWTQAMIDSLMPAVLGDERVAALHAGCEMVDYLEAHIQRRRCAPGEPPNDLLTLLLAAEDSDDTLTSEELVCMVMVLLGAGNSTTTDLLGNAVLMLSENPAQRAELIANPELVEPAIEEILRLEPSLRLVMRKTIGEIEIGERTIQDGTFLWVCNASANRDPRRFEDPEVFDIRRDNRRHLAFGGGIHYCLGAPLARLESRIMLSRFLGRFPNTRLLVNGSPKYKPDFISRSLQELPIVLA